LKEPTKSAVVYLHNPLPRISFTFFHFCAITLLSPSLHFTFSRHREEYPYSANMSPFTSSLISLLPLLPLFLRAAEAAPAAAPLDARAVNLGFPYGQQKVRGVNLGGVSDFARILLPLRAVVIADDGSMCAELGKTLTDSGSCLNPGSPLPSLTGPATTPLSTSTPFASTKTGPSLPAS
jgi:hypothetical protein